jgi:acyl-CoA thioesterase
MADEPLGPGEAESRDVAELLSVLDLEELDRDIFRGVNPRGDARRPRLFGGQVAAQAARAASLTVADDRLLHSLHGYFLRGGQADRPTILHVDRDRDGRSFSARHVTARQDGKAIMSLLVSFTVGEEGHEFQTPSLVGTVPPPEEVAAADANSVHHAIFDLRVLGRCLLEDPASLRGPGARRAARRPAAARLCARVPVRHRDRSRQAG